MTFPLFDLLYIQPESDVACLGELGLDGSTEQVHNVLEMLATEFNTATLQAANLAEIRLGTGEGVNTDTNTEDFYSPSVLSGTDTTHMDRGQRQQHVSATTSDGPAPEPAWARHLSGELYAKLRRISLSTHTKTSYEEVIEG